MTNTYLLEAGAVIGHLHHQPSLISLCPPRSNSARARPGGQPPESREQLVGLGDRDLFSGDDEEKKASQRPARSCVAGHTTVLDSPGPKSGEIGGVAVRVRAV